MSRKTGIIGGGLAGWAAAWAVRHVGGSPFVWQREGLEEVSRSLNRALQMTSLARSALLAHALHAVKGCANAETEVRKIWAEIFTFFEHLAILAQRGDEANLAHFLSQKGITWYPHAALSEIGPTRGGWTLWSEASLPVIVERLILASGGGKNRGHTWLAQFGHTIRPPFPAFGGLRSSDRRLARLPP